MTQDDQTFILQQFTQHLAANSGNRITDALGQGLMGILTQLTTMRLDMPPPSKEEERAVEQP